jgi:hypothetical protein
MDPIPPPVGRRSQARRVDPVPPRAPGTRIGPLALALTPTRAMLAIALVGSGLFVLYGLVARDATQIPVLCAGFGVFGIAFSALAVAGAIGTYRAAGDDRGRRAFLLAGLGGLAALIAAGSFSVAVVLALVWRG